MDKACALCANNPNKRCLDHDNFDECYADNQALKAKCDADVFVQLVSQTTGLPANLPGVEIQVTEPAFRPHAWRRHEVVCASAGVRRRRGVVHAWPFGQGRCCQGAPSL